MEDQTEKQRRAKKLFDGFVLVVCLAFVLPVPCQWLIEAWPKPAPEKPRPQKSRPLTDEEWRAVQGTDKAWMAKAFQDHLRAQLMLKSWAKSVTIIGSY